MSDANPTSEAGAGAEALLGLAAQAGQAVRLPSLPSIAKQQPAHDPFLPAPPSLALPTQPQPQQPPQQTLQPQTAAAPLPPAAATLPAPPSLPRERLPTLSEWADPAFRPFPPPPPILAPLPDRWQGSTVPPPPSQYPYHNPWQSYPYPPPYYYYQQQNMSYPVPHQPSVAPVPPPLALPNPPVVPPLRVPMHADPVRDAAATNESAFQTIPQQPTISTRDPLLERLTSEAAELPKKTPSRARGLADLMNPTDTIPVSSAAISQSRMETPLIKPETIETKVTPVTVPSVPSAEPKLSDIVKERSHSGTLDLAVIAGVSPENIHKDAPQTSETSGREQGLLKEPGDDNGPKDAKQPEASTSSDRREQREESEKKSIEETRVPVLSSDDEKTQNMTTSDSFPKEKEDVTETKDDSCSNPDLLDEEDEDIDKEKEDGESGDEVTRCPCGSTVNSGTMIACDQCNTWQHSKCMGFRRSSEVPDEYYCHVCRPDQIRPTCVAHPRYKERSARERSSQDRRDYESQLTAVKPLELRKLFVSDLRHKKALLRSKAEVFLRYAGHVKNQYGKNRASVIDGLMILLDMQRQDVVERIDAALKRLKTEKPEDLERKRSGTTAASEAHLSDTGNTRTPGGSRGQAQKRARPHSLFMDGLEGPNGPRGEGAEAMGDLDLGADAMHGRNMSREERKLRQTMKLFARMEEREREKKRPRTGDVNASPKTGPPSRSRTPKPSQSRTISPKLATATESEEDARKGPSVSRQDMETTDGPEKRVGPISETRIVDMPDQNLQQEDAAEPKIVQPLPQLKSSLASRSEQEIGKKEQRKDRLERSAPRRKESCSPDSLNGNANGRRRSILARERSQESKRRRAGLPREAERRNSIPKEPQKQDSSPELSVVLPGPSVIGSKKIAKAWLSTLDREIREKEELVGNHDCDQAPTKASKKERLLEDARQEAMKKFLNGGKSPSPMKKRYQREGELRAEESDFNGSEEENESEQELKESALNGTTSETLSVSMVVVSEKGSLPDRGQILESTRLILPGANGKIEDGTAGKRDSSRTACLKKRPIMLNTNAEAKEAEAADMSLKPTDAEEPVFKQFARSKLSSSSVRSPQKSPPSPLHRVASPQLRSCPPPVLRSPSLRSVPAEDARQPVGSPSPLPSFRSQKLSPSLQKRRPQSPGTEKKQKEGISSLTKLSSGSSPLYIAEDRARRNSPDLSVAIDRSGEKPKGSEESAPSMPVSKTSPDTKSTQNSSAPPLLRSIRSVPPPPPPKRIEHSTETPAGTEGGKGGASNDSGQPALGKRASGGETISAVFQQRVQGFLRPSGSSPSPSPRGPGPKYGLSSPLPSPRATNTSHVNAVSPAPGVRGSASSLGAALPLGSKPHLDGMRTSNGFSPRVSGSGHVYSRGYGPSFRSKPTDGDRPWNSVPTFSSLKRQHGFGRGSRGSSVIGGKPGPFSGVDRGRHGHGRDGPSSYGRDDMMDKNRGGYRRDGPFLVSDDDKVQNGNPHSWGRSYSQRVWGGGGPGHYSSGDGSGRGSRRGHHGN